MSKEMANACRT